METRSSLAKTPIESMAISRFKATCLAVLERVRQTGQPLLVTKRGKPVAQILPPPAPEAAGESRYGCMQGKIEFLGDVLEPLPAEEWEALR